MRYFTKPQHIEQCLVVWFVIDWWCVTNLLCIPLKFTRPNSLSKSMYHKVAIPMGWPWILKHYSPLSVYGIGVLYSDIHALLMKQIWHNCYAACNKRSITLPFPPIKSENWSCDLMWTISSSKHQPGGVVGVSSLQSKKEACPTQSSFTGSFNATKASYNA